MREDYYKRYSEKNVPFEWRYTESKIAGPEPDIEKYNLLNLCKQAAVEGCICVDGKVADAYRIGIQNDFYDECTTLLFRVNSGLNECIQKPYESELLKATRILTYRNQKYLVIFCCWYETYTFRNSQVYEKFTVYEMSAKGALKALCPNYKELKASALVHHSEIISKIQGFKSGSDSMWLYDCVFENGDLLHEVFATLEDFDDKFKAWTHCSDCKSMFGEAESYCEIVPSELGEVALVVGMRPLTNSLLQLQIRTVKLCVDAYTNTRFKNCYLASNDDIMPCLILYQQAEKHVELLKKTDSRFFIDVCSSTHTPITRFATMSPIQDSERLACVTKMRGKYYLLMPLVPEWMRYGLLFNYRTTVRSSNSLIKDMMESGRRDPGNLTIEDKMNELCDTWSTYCSKYNISADGQIREIFRLQGQCKSRSPSTLTAYINDNYLSDRKGTV